MSFSCLSSLCPLVCPHFSVCAECQCHGHADSCHFSQRVWLSTGGTSGGICNECRHNTFGRRCQRCRHGFRRHPSLPLNSPHACTRKRDTLYSSPSCQTNKQKKNLEWLDCRIHLKLQELWMKLNRTIHLILPSAGRCVQSYNWTSCHSIKSKSLNSIKCFLCLFCGRLLVWSAGIIASSPWGGRHLVPSSKWAVPLQNGCGGHELQSLSPWLLGLRWGGLQTLRLPPQLWCSHRAVFDQVNHK